MELNIKPYHKNLFPLGAILVKDASAAAWMSEIQRMGFSLREVRIFPVPGITANSVWGCIVIPNQLDQARLSSIELGRNECCQRLSPHFYIAEKAVLHPVATTSEIEQLFSTVTVIHPEFGMAELTEELDLGKLIAVPEMKSVIVTQPAPSVFIPKQVRSFQVQPVPPEEVLRNLEENAFPKQEALEDKPLTPTEKLKLSLYKKLFRKVDEPGKAGHSTTEKTGLLSDIESFLGKIGGNLGSKLTERMQNDFEDLEKRNQEKVEKLLDMLRNNPEEALKYAIPLDMENSTRGGESNGAFNLSMRWSDLSLNTGMSRSGTGGGSINLGDHFENLRRQYEDTAQALIDKKEFQKAAFVYMKLLKNHYKAAETLEKAEFYQQAATIYLKHANNKQKAAECYEKGNMILDAIELYKELESNEKVGDLYIGISKRKEGMVYYEKVVDAYKSNGQYIKASLLYKNKMQNEAGAHALLLDGWKENKDAVNCLTMYFDDFVDLKSLGKEINAVYKDCVHDVNREMFLQVIRKEYDKKNELAEPIREMAYEIIAARIAVNPEIVSELKAFNQDDKELVKDTIRFKLRRK